MADVIDKIEIFIARIPRDEPYLGPLEHGNKPTDKGLFIRPRNRSVYSINDESVVVKMTTRDGIVGWGEGWAIVAPEISATIIRDLIAPFVIGRDPQDVVVIYEDLYDAMRVRGFFGGFYVDAIAAVDIALWDIKGRQAGLSIAQMLGGKRHETIPAYVSGLPKSTLNERATLAQEWVDKGFRGVKFASAVATEGEVKEIRTLRETLGNDVDILCDFHWRYTAGEAIKLISQMEAYDLYLAEAPCNSEDMEGQAMVARSVKTPVAIGEELRTVYEFRPRFENRCMSIIQPEIAHMGITAFWQVCQMAQAFHVKVIPHASIGIGIFQAASLQASAAVSNLGYHEYQHSIFDRNLKFITGTMRCENGYYTVPDGVGLGVSPTELVMQYLSLFM